MTHEPERRAQAVVKPPPYPHPAPDWNLDSCQGEEFDGNVPRERGPFARVRPELETLVEGVAFVPERTEVTDARAVLERDGALILSGYRPGPDSLARAAAEVLGADLRHVQPARINDSDRGDGLPLHTESRCQVIEVGGVTVDLYGPDADYLLILCGSQSTTGGASIVADGYRLVARIKDARPELWGFLTGADIDRLALWRDLPDIPTTPSACRHVEYTHAGRMIVKASWGARPLPRDTRRDEHERMLELYADVWTTLTAGAPRFTLATGEILFVDNYRCLHGVDAYETRRIMHSLTVRSVYAR